MKPVFALLVSIILFNCNKGSVYLNANLASMMTNKEIAYPALIQIA